MRAASSEGGSRVPPFMEVTAPTVLLHHFCAQFNLVSSRLATSFRSVSFTRPSRSDLFVCAGTPLTPRTFAFPWDRGLVSGALGEAAAVTNMLRGGRRDKAARPKGLRL